MVYCLVVRDVEIVDKAVTHHLPDFHWGLNKASSQMTLQGKATYQYP